MDNVWTEVAPDESEVCARSAFAEGGVPPEDPNSRSVGGVLAALARDPGRYLLARWNWKSALMSSLLRATIFFCTNLVAGLHAALGAMLAELILRGATSGFYGAITEALSSARPTWAAATAAMILLPLMAHSIEFVVHWLRHTPKLALSIGSSVVFTAISTAFNLYAMQRGALRVGHGSRPLQEDLTRVPGLILDFLLAGPRYVVRALLGRNRSQR